MREHTPRSVSVHTQALHSAAVPFRACLWWDPADPLAVTIWFWSHKHGDPVDWVLSRELLAAGLLTTSGQMDVRVEPYVGDVLLTLDNTVERAVFLLRGPVLARFLADTYRQIPLGAEQVTVPDPGFFTDEPLRLPKRGGSGA